MYEYFFDYQQFGAGAIFATGEKIAYI